MPINPQDGKKLQLALQKWVSRGHPPGDAALIANVLGAAGTLTEVISQLFEAETCPPPCGFTIVQGTPDHSLFDGGRYTILGFLMAEHRNPGHTEVRIL